jgi:hypothetical protein
MTIKLKKAVFGEKHSRPFNSSYGYWDTLFPWHYEERADSPGNYQLITTPPYVQDLNYDPYNPFMSSVWNEMVFSTQRLDGYFVSGGYNTPEFLAAQNSNATYLPSGESYTPSYTPYNIEVRDPKYLEVINSSNTIGWPGTQGVRVGGLSLTKKKPPINRPKKPIYRLPRFRAGSVPKHKGPVTLSLIPPVAYASEGYSSYRLRLDKWLASKKKREERLTLLRDRSYERALAKYYDRLSKEKKLIAAYDALYAKRLAVYSDKLRTFERLVSEAKKPQYKKAPAYKNMILKDNPFGHISMTFFGPLRRVKFLPAFDPTYQYPLGTQYERHRGWFTPAGVQLGYSPFTQMQDNGGVNAAFYDKGIFCQRMWIIDSPFPNPNDYESLAQIGEEMRLTIFNAVEPFLDEYDRKLRRKIHSKLKGQVVHVGNLIAERKQTLDLVQSSVKRILQLVKAKKNLLKTVAAYAKDSKKIAGDILAFKFGVEPLMNDIQTFAKYIDETSDEPIIVARSNLGGANVSKGARNPGIPVNIVTPSFRFDGMLEMSYTVKCVVTNPAARSLSQFGLINPLEIAWEILPWSFVIDWFIPVGDWLSSQTSDCGLEFRTGTRKVKLVGRFTIGNSQHPTSSNPDQTGSFTGSLLGSFDGFAVDRKVLEELPDVPLPVIKNPWSWSHGVESVALAVQRLKR